MSLHFSDYHNFLRSCNYYQLNVWFCQYAFTVKEEGEVMISLMQEDTRKAKEHGAENLTIGYFVMKVTLLKQLSIIWVTSFHFWLCKPYLSEFVCFQSNICHFAVCLNAYQSLSSWRLSVDFFCHNVCLCVFDCYTTTYMCMSVSLCDHNWCTFTMCFGIGVSICLCISVPVCLFGFLA